MPSSNDLLYKSWNRMIGSMGKHAAKNGFGFSWFENFDQLGFKCSLTNESWLMDRKELLDNESIVASAFKSEEGKEKLLNSLKVLFDSTSSKEEDRDKCKATDCDKPSTKEGFCGWCHNRFKKGFLDTDGLKIRTIEEKKADLTKKMSMAKLKLYQISFPESKKSFHCKKAGIFIEEASCYYRMFVKDKKECRGCKTHEKRFDIFEKFLDETILPEVQAENK